MEEAESAALAAFITGRTLLVSRIATVEVPRAAYVATTSLAVVDRVERVLAEFNHVAVDHEICREAARLRPPGLRSLDALHLASALSVKDAIYAMVV